MNVRRKDVDPFLVRAPLRAVAVRKLSCPGGCLAGDIGLVAKPSEMPVFTSQSSREMKSFGLPK